jgi:hypothetical protein
MPPITVGAQGTPAASDPNVITPNTAPASRVEVFRCTQCKALNIMPDAGHGVTDSGSGGVDSGSGGDPWYAVWAGLEVGVFHGWVRPSIHFSLPV